MSAAASDRQPHALGLNVAFLRPAAPRGWARATACAGLPSALTSPRPRLRTGPEPVLAAPVVTLEDPVHHPRRAPRRHPRARALTPAEQVVDDRLDERLGDVGGIRQVEQLHPGRVLQPHRARLKHGERDLPVRAREAHRVVAHGARKVPGHRAERAPPGAETERHRILDRIARRDVGRRSDHVFQRPQQVIEKVQGVRSHVKEMPGPRLRRVRAPDAALAVVRLGEPVGHACQPPDRTRLEQLIDLQEARKPAAVIGDEERQAGALERLHHPVAFGAVAGHRLLHVGGLPGGSHRKRVVGMRIGGRGDVDRVHLRVGDEGPRVVVPARNAVAPRVVRRQVPPRLMTATSWEPAAFWNPGPLFTSVTSPQPMMPQRTTERPAKWFDAGMPEVLGTLAFGCSRGRRAGCGSALRLVDPNAPVFHLAVVALQPYRARRRDWHRVDQHLPVARAVGKAAPHGDDDFVPIERAVMGQRREGPRDHEVPALQLRAADKDPAVGVGARPELKLEHEVLRELLRRPEDLVLLALVRDGHDQAPVPHHIAAVVACRLAPELGALRVAPAGQVVPVEQAFVARLGDELIGPRGREAHGLEDRPQGRGPLGVADNVGVEQVGHLLLLRVPVHVRKEGPGVQDRDLRLVGRRLDVKIVQPPDRLRGPALRGGAREDLAQDDGHRGIVLAKRGEDQLHIGGDDRGVGLHLDVVRADQQHDAARVQADDVLL